jgi:prophage antirepressor-like protein
VVWTELHSARHADRLVRKEVTPAMTSTEFQPTTAFTFRTAGSKPVAIHVFVRDRRKWIVASDVCRVLGLRTDDVPKLVPEKERSRATVLSQGATQSVTTVTKEALDLLVAKSKKPAAKQLHQWLAAEVLPVVGKPRPPDEGEERQGRLF